MVTISRNNPPSVTPVRMPERERVFQIVCPSLVIERNDSRLHTFTSLTAKLSPSRGGRSLTRGHSL
jgi:hypothetical protein